MKKLKYNIVLQMIYSYTLNNVKRLFIVIE